MTRRPDSLARQDLPGGGQLQIGAGRRAIMRSRIIRPAQPALAFLATTKTANAAAATASGAAGSRGLPA
jgi:hypothetical protein